VLLDINAMQDGGQLGICRFPHLLLANRRNLRAGSQRAEDHETQARENAR
jgi:hypothetical protein